MNPALRGLMDARQDAAQVLAHVVEDLEDENRRLRLQLATALLDYEALFARIE